MGLASLPWTDGLVSLRQRTAFLRHHLGDDWPDLSDSRLLADLPDWLGPYLAGITRRAHLAQVDLASALNSLLPPGARRDLDRLAPTHIDVPSGSHVPIDYANPAEPVLAVRLQEMFGLAQTPRIAGGKVALLIHLLSPARRPVQVTRDLASFWANGYREVKAEMKGRYPKALLARRSPDRRADRARAAPAAVISLAPLGREGGCDRAQHGEGEGFDATNWDRR